MTHPAAFADAHRRHWEDAELLFAHERWSNSDQLYGFSAERGLKTVMMEQAYAQFLRRFDRLFDTGGDGEAL